jgi:2,5-diketo-D-gluconate reductase A
VLLDDAEIGRIAATHGKTTAQVTLRWHIQRGHIIFPKSMHRERMQENLAIFDFELSAEDHAAITALGRGEAGRRGPNPSVFDWIP